MDIFAWIRTSDTDMENLRFTDISPYRPPSSLSPLHLALAQTSSLQCNPEPCRWSCTWPGGCHLVSYQSLFLMKGHRGHTKSRLIENKGSKFNQPILTAVLLNIQNPADGEIISTSILRMIIATHLVTLSPQNSVITVCPVTPSTLMIMCNVDLYLVPPLPLLPLLSTCE